jgi:hypothetical protein
MEREDKNRVTPDIDEDFMMSLMVDGVKKQGLVESQPSVDGPASEKPVVKEKTKGKKMPDSEYERIFFKKTETNARDGKSVYIQPDFHEKLTRIVQVIGEDKITIYAYLNNVLEHHFQEFGEQITGSYNKKYKPIL